MIDPETARRMSDAWKAQFDGVCCLCREPIEKGYMVTDDDGYTYCENCWQP